MGGPRGPGRLRVGPSIRRREAALAPAPAAAGNGDGGAGWRWPGWRGPGWAVALVLLAACSRSSPPEGIARRFVEAYYVRVDLGAARGLAGGLASKKIEEQVDLTRGQAVGAATEGREVAYSLVSRQEDGDSHRFMYEVRIRPRGGGEFTRRSVVSVGQVGGAWRVTNFHESGP